MVAIISVINWAQDILDKIIEAIGFIGPLLLRLYLVPVFWMAGSSKINMGTLLPYDGTVGYFEGLGIPLPFIGALLAGWTELLGAIFLLFGFATRWTSIPLMFTMIVAALTAHLQNGWLAIASGSGLFVTERTAGAIERLDRAKDILKEHGHYGWLTENGPLVILNNGIEFAATYFIMLLALLVVGGGKYVSADYWVAKKFRA